MQPTLLRGSLWMVLAALGFSIMGLLIKLSSVHSGTAQQLFIRSAVVLLVSVLVVWSQGLQLKTSHWRLHAARSVFGYTAMALLFYCLGILPLSVGIALNYTAPFFTLCLAWMLLGEPLRRGQVIAVLLGFAGVLLLLTPVFGEGMLVPACLALLSGFFLGVTNITLRRLGTSREPVWLVLLYFSVSSTLISGLWSLFQGEWSVDVKDYLVLSGIGFAAVVGQYALTRAYKDGSPAIVATLSYSTLVFTALFGAVFLGESLGVDALLGIAAVIAAGALAAFSGMGVRKSGSDGA